MSQATLSKWENGIHPADFEAIARIRDEATARGLIWDDAWLFEDRSLGCIAEVPQGAVAWFMRGDAGSVQEATDAASADALAALGDAPPLGVLAFDCIARRGVLGDDGIRAEVERIAAAAGDVPVAGFYPYGEIARTRGISGFHNQTLVLLALA